MTGTVDTADQTEGAGRKGGSPQLSAISSDGPTAKPRLGADFGKLWTAAAFSNLADGVGRVAVPLIATTLTRDPLAIAAIGALAFVPWLVFGLPAGMIVDRYDRRRIMALANALLKLERGVHIAPMQVNPATAHMYIVNPLFGGGMSKLFSTHPATEERVARLEEMARNSGISAAMRSWN